MLNQFIKKNGTNLIWEVNVNREDSALMLVFGYAITGDKIKNKNNRNIYFTEF